MQNTRTADGDMKTTVAKLLAITALAFILRLALLSLVQNPGINDPVHYFNLGRRLAAGHGFTIDYVWHYARMPVDIVHATDHWLPLPGLAVALGMVVGGANVHAALALFVLAGSALPALLYAMMRQLELSESCALSAAAFAAVLPEFALNSLRTDTTILNAVLVVAAILFLLSALNSGKRLACVLCGVAFGLAHLTRNDSIILFALLAGYLVIADAKNLLRIRRANFALILLAFAITVTPWHIRNLYEIGALGSPQTSRMPFMVEPKDLYAYGLPITLESMLERQSVGELIGKRVFEFGAAVKQMAIALQLPLVILIPAGIYWLARGGNRKLLCRMLPALIWIAGLLIIYPLLMPVHNQGGSFKKAFVTITPMLIPAGAIALEQLVRRSDFRNLILLVSLCWLAWNSYDLVKRETSNADTFYASMQVLVDSLQTLPDQNGDGEIRLMTQDPYVLSVFGYSSVVIPQASREDTLALASQFDIDYLLMPAARPALDPLYLGNEIDPRFVLEAHVDDAGEIPFELYSFESGREEHP